MNRYLLIIMVIVAVFYWGNSNLYAQQSKNPQEKPQKEFDQKRIFTGGNIGLSFSNTGSYVLISPLLGYWVTPKISVGAGPSFEYYKYGSFSQTNFGGRVFGRYYPFPNLFAHAEYEVISYKSSGMTERKTGSRLPIGAGYSQSLGGGIYANAMVLYDVLYSADSPFGGYISGGLMVRAGVTMGFGGRSW